jgi:hypothetical protein
MSKSTSEELLSELSELRSLFPNWRIGQLIMNVAMAAGAADPATLWDIGDEELLAAARRLIQRNRNRDETSVQIASVSD